MCNNVGGHYATANQFGSITESHKCAIEQIKQAHLGTTPHYKVLDVGVGNGAFLQKLKECMPQADFLGIDISKEMLQRAHEALDLTTIETSATQASRFVPHHSQDLVLAHFINAYIPIHTLFHEARLLTRANGYFSLITSTYESFPIAQQALANFISQESVLSRIVGHYYKGIVKNTTVAGSENELLHAFDEHKFRIISHRRLHIPITLNTIDDLALFGIEGTWFLNSLSVRMLPKNFLIQRLTRLFSKIFNFPYQDTHIIDVVLAQK